MITPWQSGKLRTVYERPEIKASLEIVLSVFMVVILLTLAIRPTLATVATLQKKIEDQTLVDNKLGTKITQLTRANADLSTYADRIPDFSSAVTDLPDESGLAKRLEIVARENNITLNTLSFDAIPLFGNEINLADKDRAKGKPKMEDGGKVASFEISFDISGGAEQVFDFLAGIENLDRVLLISNVSFKKEETKAAGTTAAVNNVHTIGKASGFYVLANKP